MDETNPKPTLEETEAAGQKLFREGLRSSSTFLSSFVAQPDHVAVILATSKMDDLLGFVVRKRLLPCPEKKDDLLDSERGLGTFSNRILLAHRLGLIDASLARALHLFRKIRNDFAHSYDGQALDQSPHRDRIAELGTKIDTHPHIVSLREQIGSLAVMSPQKLSFVLAATFAITRLEMLKLVTDQVDADSARHGKFP